MNIKYKNKYDENDFFDDYLKFRKDKPENNKFELECILTFIADVSHLDVLDIGCGYGDICRKVLDMGACSVTGVDMSSNMINLAINKSKNYSNLQYICSDFMQYDSNKKFDLVLSSYCIHYVNDIDTLFAKISAQLKINGTFIFSQQHPLFTSRSKSQQQNNNFWTIESYLLENARINPWIGHNDTISYHRTFSTIINSTIKNDLQIVSILEPSNPSSNQDTLPPFLMIKCIKIK